MTDSFLTIQNTTRVQKHVVPTWNEIFFWILLSVGGWLTEIRIVEREGSSIPVERTFTRIIVLTPFIQSGPPAFAAPVPNRWHSVWHPIPTIRTARAGKQQCHCCQQCGEWQPVVPTAGIFTCLRDAGGPCTMRSARRPSCEDSRRCTRRRSTIADWPISGRRPRGAN